MTVELFKQLASYYRCENDLSNITCALCMISPLFRKWFVNFFFPHLDVERIRSIEREVTDEKDMHSRVDIMIRMEHEEQPYLIEVKIYDRQHHFGQYETAHGIPKERLGYITNYVCTEGLNAGYDVKTWSDWYASLEKHSDELYDEEEKHLCLGYMAYLKRICGFTELITVLNSSEETLTELMKAMKKALNNCSSDFALHITSTLAKDYTYTFLFGTDKNTELGGWLGILNPKTNPTICLGFQSNQKKSKPIYDKIKQEGMPESDVYGEHLCIHAWSGRCIIVPMSEKMHTKFKDSATACEQIDVLVRYIGVVLKQVGYDKK